MFTPAIQGILHGLDNEEVLILEILVTMQINCRVAVLMHPTVQSESSSLHVVH